MSGKAPTPAAAAPAAAPGASKEPAGGAGAAGKDPAGKDPAGGGGTGKPLTKEQEELIRRRPGFTYHAVDVDWPGSKKALGIILSTRLHRVVVAELRPGSVGAEQLKVLDHVVAVNGLPVSDKSVAKQIILKNNGKFTALVERPGTAEAASEFQSTGAAASPASAVSAPPGATPPGSPTAAAPSPAPAPTVTPGAAASVLLPPPVGPTTPGPKPAPIIPAFPADVQQMVEKHLAERASGAFAVTAKASVLKKAGTKGAGALSVRAESTEYLFHYQREPGKKIRNLPPSNNLIKPAPSDSA